MAEISGIIETLTAGGKHSETVEILYQDSAGRIVSAETEPYEIQNETYICWCCLRKRLVKIRLEDIVDAVLTGKSFAKRFNGGFE